MRHGAITAIAVFMLIGSSAAHGRQITPADRTVTALGIVTLKHQPNVLRANIELTGQGKDVKEAIANLAAERDGARSRLVSLGVVEKSIKIGDPQSGSGAALNPQMRQYAQAYMMSRGRPAKSPTTQPANVIVSAALTAEWELGGATPDEKLVTAMDLQQKIKEAFATSARALSPEEQEVIEEMRGSGMMPNQPNPGEPTFQFVARISEEDYKKALEQAFQKALAEAGRIASATGANLGDIRQLTVGTRPGSTNDAMYAAYSGYNVGQSTPGSNEDGSKEAVGQQPGPVQLIVTVNASFTLK